MLKDSLVIEQPFAVAIVLVLQYLQKFRDASLQMARHHFNTNSINYVALALCRGDGPLTYFTIQHITEHYSEYNESKGMVHNRYSTCFAHSNKKDYTISVTG